jgi:pimeloyl-ACP methyl ester carboxylesterase
MYRTSLHEYDSLRKLPSTPELKNKIKVYRLMPFEPHIKAEDLAKIKCPSLIIGGDHDIILPQHTLLIAQSIPNSYLWIIPNAGHLTPIFHRDDFNKVVMEFFIKPYRKPWFYN